MAVAELRPPQPFFILAVIFSLTMLVFNLIPRVAQTVTRLSFVAFASTAIKTPLRFPLYRHERRAELSERRKIPGASTVQEVPCNVRTVRRPVRQNSTSNWSGAPHTGTDRRGSCSGSGRENRQICTPGIPWLQRPVAEPWLDKYSFSMISHDLFLWVRKWFCLC